ncbi:hypothetical protein OIU84_023913 [Salix udensis]|uniref:Uncharacterized protein n=1 Tax=Salix udensis TaxID=889485 RepID=A0AAD6J8V7_9ROSI|nr:hypothetical protein OIU84_023913 [Salix udensis]
MRLGLFNGDPRQASATSILVRAKSVPKNIGALALEATLDGIVMLNNYDRFLQLSKSRTSSLAVIGPNAHNSTNLLGNYFGPTAKKRYDIGSIAELCRVTPRMAKVAIMFRALR